MNIAAAKTRITTLRQDDPGFMISDGFVIAPRAGFEVSGSCPREYQMILAQCIDHGWIKPVANVYGRDLTFQTLKESK